MTDTGNLPKWKNADRVYANAYKMLEAMAKNGHVTKSHGLQKWKGNGQTGWGNVGDYCIPSDDMNNLIEALDKGDEERIKGLMILYRAYNFDVQEIK